MNSILFLFILSPKLRLNQKNNRKPQLFEVLLAIRILYVAFNVLLIYMIQMLHNFERALQTINKITLYYLYSS